MSALLAAAKKKNTGQTLYATSGNAVAFMRFMDHFAHGVGTRCPLHIPLITAPLMQLIVRKEHVQQTALAMPAEAPTPQVPGWTPVVPDYREGLDQITASWRG